MVERSYLIFEILAVLLCMHGLYGEKFRWDIYTILFISVEFISYQIEYVYGSFPGWEVILYVLLFCYCRIHFKGEWRKSVLNYILCVILSAVVQVLCYLPIMIWHTYNTKFVNLFVNILLLAGIYTLYRIGTLNKISKYMYLKWKTAVGVLLIVVLFIVTFLYFFNKNGSIQTFDYFVLVLSSISLFSLLYLLQKERYINKQIIMEKDMNNLYGNALAELMEKVRINQHDYKNHLTAIQGMAYSANSIEELRIEQGKYFQMIFQEDKYSNLISGNNNLTIAGFLFSKLCNYDDDNIEVNYDLKIGEIDDIFLIVDIIKIAGVLIDNSYEEISKKDYDKKKIYIEISKKESVFIKVGNTCNHMNLIEIEKYFKKGYSSKGTNRGLGLYTVLEIVKKRKGNISPECSELKQENWFFITINLPL